MAFRHMLLDVLQWMGIVLLHFLWQGLLVGAAYAAIRVLLPRGTARYRLGVVALMSLSLCPLITAWMLRMPTMVPLDSTLKPAVMVIGGSKEPSVSILEHLTGPFGVTLWVAVIWLSGVLVLSVRVWRQWHALRNLVVAGLDDDGPVRHMLLCLSQRFGMHRPVSLVWSASVGTPLLVGWFKPAIVMPLAMVSGFPRPQLELVLAHELAHLKRMDPVVNFFQVALETLFFFHPAVHWISADVRNEREICCDQMALAVHGGNWRDLARALSTLGDMQRAGPMVLAASGGVLLDRVHQLAAGERGVMSASSHRPYSGALLALGMLATLVLGLALKREDVPDLVGPIPRMASLIAVPLAQSLQQAWRPGDLLPSNAPLQRPVSTPGASEASLPPLPRVGVALAASRALPSLAIANLVPRNKAMRPAYSTAMHADSPALAPLRIRKPVYPAEALEKGIEGKVVIEFGVANDGSVQGAEVVSAEPVGVFEQAALVAMREWIYSVPPGHAVSERYRQVLAFSVNGRGNGTDREIQANLSCQVMTGTHICRKPEEAARQLVVDASSK